MEPAHISKAVVAPKVTSLREGRVLTLTAMLVLGECESLITDTDIGALEVLAGPMGQTQAWILAALIYIWEGQGDQEARTSSAVESQALFPWGVPTGSKPEFLLWFQSAYNRRLLGPVCLRG